MGATRGLPGGRPASILPVAVIASARIALVPVGRRRALVDTVLIDAGVGASRAVSVRMGLPSRPAGIPVGTAFRIEPRLDLAHVGTGYRKSSRPACGRRVDPSVEVELGGARQRAVEPVELDATARRSR